MPEVTCAICSDAVATERFEVAGDFKRIFVRSRGLDPFKAGIIIPCCEKCCNLVTAAIQEAAEAESITDQEFADNRLERISRAVDLSAVRAVSF